SPTLKLTFCASNGRLQEGPRAREQHPSDGYRRAMGMRAESLLRTCRAARRGVARALVLVACGALPASPAAAQFWGDPFWQPRPQRPIPQRQQPQSMDPFGGFFQRPLWQPRAAPRPSRIQMGDFSKAPPPRKLENPPTTTVVVMGDAMADWLGH